MAFPSAVLKQCVPREVSVELKNGETYNGILQKADAWMNLAMSDVICTSSSGEIFVKMPQVVIRGNTVKCILMKGDVLSKPVFHPQQEQQQQRRKQYRPDNERPHSNAKK